jgi:hypothetical protein
VRQTLRILPVYFLLLVLLEVFTDTPWSFVGLRA